MIHFFRHKKSSIIKLMLFSILIIAFIVWGIGSIPTSKESDSILQIGKVQISSSEFFDSYQSNLQQFQNIMPESHVPKNDIVNFTLTQLIQKNLLLEYARSIGLTVTNQQLINFIKKMPIFFDSNGHFNSKKMDSVLENNHLTRKKFLQNISDVILLKQLNPIINFHFFIPKTIVQHVLQVIYSSRTLLYFTIPYQKIVHQIPKPSIKEQKIYYKEHKELFAVPESRVVEILLLPSNFFQKKITFTNKEILSAYQTHKGLFTQPEYRSILMMSFTTKKQAESAYHMLQNNHNFLKVAKLKGFSKDSLPLKKIKKSDIPDPVLQKYAFSLKKEQYSQPIHSHFGWVIIKVTNIFPSHTLSLSKIKNQLIIQLKKEKNIELLESTKRNIDNQLLKNKDLHGIAKTMNLPFQEIEVQSNRQLKSFKKIQFPNLTKMIFNTKINTVNQTISTKNGYLYFMVKKIIPKKYKSFTKVDSQIKLLIKKNFINEYVNSWAKKDINIIPKNLKTLKLKKVTFTLHALPLKKINLPNDFVQKTINTLPNTWTFFPDGKRNLLYIGMISNIKKPNSNIVDKNIPIFIHTINNSRSNISSRQILQALYEKTNIKINHNLIEQIIND